MKPRIKQHEPASRPFWAVSVHSKSGIAHLVDQAFKNHVSDKSNPAIAHFVTQDLHKSCCGLYFSPYELQSAGSSGIGAPRCKWCMSSKDKDNG